MSGIIGDALGHGITIKSFASEDYEEKRLDRSLAKMTDAQYWSWMTSIPADVGRMLLAAATTGILLIMTAHMYQQHAISIAIVALVQLYVIKLVSATQDISDLIKAYEAIMSSAYQSVKTMLVEPTIVDKERPIKIKRGAALDIVFSDVTYSYADTNAELRAIDSFALHIRPGEKVGFVGYSGSGKTTLTKLLLRFMDVTSGSIKLADIDIRDLSQQDLRDHIAYVPQEPLLFHRSIEENIAYGRPSASKKVIREAAKAAYVDEFATELPKGYDTHVGERGIKLSGGQRQRVAIARAILKDAPILVLDEATSALDSRSEKLIQSALWRLMKGRTALVVAHRLSTIQHMDRIVVMNKGRIEQMGTHEELLQQKRGTYAKLWAHQSGGYLGGATNLTESSDETL
jgi:ATP-binding cassette subfamily B protein